jgi:hypothetical protein
MIGADGGLRALQLEVACLIPVIRIQLYVGRRTAGRARRVTQGQEPLVGEGRELG